MPGKNLALNQSKTFTKGTLIDSFNNTNLDTTNSSPAGVQ